MRHFSFDVVIQEEFNMVVCKWQYVYHGIQIYTVNNSQSGIRTQGLLCCAMHTKRNNMHAILRHTEFKCPHPESLVCETRITHY